MAKVVYVNGSTGNDVNSGLTPLLAKATIVGARAAAVPTDRVSIAAGVYLEIDASFTSANDSNVVYMNDGSGSVIVDFANRATAGQHWFTDKSIRFIGLHFRNPGTITYCIASFSIAANTIVHNCVFYQKSGAPNTGRGVQTIEAHNCSFHNLSIGLSGAPIAYGNYLLSCTTPVTGGTTRDYNAFAGNTEVNGINISTGANPGFTNPALDDFRISQSIPASFQTFMVGGRDHGRIGASGTGGAYYSSSFEQTRMITPTPSPGAFVSWENDPSYVADGVLGAIIEDPTTKEPVLDRATTPGATDGRLRSDVFDAGGSSGYTPGSASIGRFIDPPSGSMLDINTSLPVSFEYRSSGIAFLKGDVLPVWASIQQSDYISTPKRYIQYRITFRMDHTNL